MDSLKEMLIESKSDLLHGDPGSTGWIAQKDILKRGTFFFRGTATSKCSARTKCFQKALCFLCFFLSGLLFCVFFGLKVLFFSDLGEILIKIVFFVYFLAFKNKHLKTLLR